MNKNKNRDKKMLFYPGTNCHIHRVGKGRNRKKIKIDNRIRHCVSCGERKKIGSVVATAYNKIIHNYCEDCYILYREQFKGIEKLGLKLVISKNIKKKEKDKMTEVIWIYDKKVEKDITKIFKDDAFMRISYLVRESNVLHSGKSGCILYVKANPEEIKLLEEKLVVLSTEKITGAEEKTIIETFKKEEDDAAFGMGMIFGGLAIS